MQKKRERRKLRTYHRFALFHVFLLEQKLTIQVGQVNGVKVQYGDMAKSSHDDILHYAHVLIRIVK
jgi:hypothetical protein